jgi:hypothetical protein
MIKYNQRPHDSLEPIKRAKGKRPMDCVYDGKDGSIIDGKNGSLMKPFMFSVLLSNIKTSG